MRKSILILSLLFINYLANAQYCTPIYTSAGVMNGTISQITIAGHSSAVLDDMLPTSIITSGYLDRSSFTSMLPLQQGREYTCTLSYFEASAHTGNQIWIDFNNDNIFADSEQISLVYPTSSSFATSVTSSSFSIYIPLSAPAGPHTMRVRNVVYDLSATTGYPSASIDPCATTDAINQYTHGATADYQVNIIAGTACSGTPEPGSISGPSSICHENSFTLSPINDSINSSLQYQWLSRPYGIGTFSIISGATSRAFHIGSQTVATEYQLNVRCAVSGIVSSTSSFTVNQNTYYLCYCAASVGGDSASASIDSFSFAGTSLNNFYPRNPAGYTSFPDTGRATTTVSSGTTYNAFIKAGGTQAYNAYAWIDVNHNGVYEADEYTVIGTGVTAGGRTNHSINIPATADTGLTGLRVRLIASSTSFSGADACMYTTMGQTHDYKIRINATSHCAGTPSAGIATASASSVCSGIPFYVTAIGTTTGLDLEYQWFERSAGAFTAISGATNSILDVSSISTATDFAMVVRCTTSGLSDTSSIATVEAIPYYLCYCSPYTGTTLNHDDSRAPLDSFYITTSTLGHATGSTAVYNRYYPTTGTTTTALAQGTHYILSVHSSGTASYNTGAWIDYDHNSIFSASEYIHIATGQVAGTTANAETVIPSSSITGTTGLRIRTTDDTSSLTESDGCSDIFNGATADYVIDLTAGTPCSGTPFAGISTSSIGRVCNGISFSLNNSGATNTAGISYQWMRANSGTGTYTALSGATNRSYNMSAQTVTTDYILVATCSVSGIADSSSPVTVIQNPFYLCYCNEATGYVLNDSASVAPIDTLSIISTTLANGTVGSTTRYRQFYPAEPFATCSLAQGNTYTLLTQSSGSASYNARGWIDYNHNGEFETTESFSITSGATSGTIILNTFTVAAGADTGITGMRIRTTSSATSLSASDACTGPIPGVTHDYNIRIISGSTCSGTPFGGTSYTSAIEVCLGETFTLTNEGHTSSTGITYQWIRAVAGSSSFSALSGATAPFLHVGSQSVASDYALIVTCSASGQRDTSAIVTVGMKAFYRCYCAPITGFVLNNIATEAPIDSVSISGTSLINHTPGSTAVYRQYYPVTTSTTTSVNKTYSYTLSMKSNGTSAYNSDAWIDYNRNGIFETTEFIPAGSSISAGAVTSGSTTIPATADTGLTGMRVRTAQSSYAMGAGDACTNAYSGATHDYIIRILPQPPCTGTPAVSVAYSSVSTICPATSFTLTDTGYTNSLTVTHQWQSRPASGGTFTAIAGATNPTFVVTAQSVATEYRFASTCTATSLTAFSNVVTVAQTPYYTCYCTGTLGTSSALSRIENVHIPASTLHVTGVRTEVRKSFGMVGDSTGTIQKSLPYSISVRVTGGSAYNTGMWIDYNHNGIYETTEYTRIDTNATSGATATITFTIPAGADTGITGLRIRATPSTNTFTAASSCTNISNSQTFDFRIKIDTLVTCSGAPEAGTITSSSSFACPSMTFTLTNAGYAVGSGISWQWLKRNTGAGAYTAISGATNHTHTVTGQTVSTDYILVSRCSFTSLRDTSNVLTIIEYPFDSCYCSPPTGVTLMTTGGHHNILLTSIVGTTMYSPEQSPDTNGYVSVPPTPAYNTANMVRGTTYPATVFVNNTSYTITAAGIWIDYNHSSTFDATEYIALTQSSDFSNWYGNITIPASSLIGQTGMRIMTTESGTITSSCGVIAAGQVQDHIITISRPPCYSVSSASIFSITDSSARASWGRVTGSAGYQYVIDTFSTDPSGSGIATSDTTLYSGCLRSGTTYYLHLRDSCDLGYFSSWLTVPFTTLTCTAVTGLVAGSIGATSGTISWTAVSGTTGYEYVVDTTAALPLGAGTPITGTSFVASSLIQGTVYYAHIRAGCNCSNRSAWQTISFTTLCDTVHDLTAFNILDTAASIRWDSIIGVSNYAYVINTTSTAPSIPGTALSDTSVRINGLTPGTLYYAHVRHACSGSFSAWRTIPFTTSRCDTVTGLTATPTDTGIIFTWTPVSGSLGYYYVVNNTSGPPSVLGTFTTSPPDTVGGLFSSTVYYVHVRNACGGGLSAWKTVMVTTLPCGTISGISATYICDTSAHVEWTAPSGGLGYMYVVNTTSSIPTIPGTYTFAPYVDLTTLSAGTTYYAHIRRICSTHDTSAWVTGSFATLTCDSVAGLVATGISTTGATISWTAASCAPGYMYVLNTTPGDPSVSGTYYTTTSVTESALASGTTYYAHVRVVCGGGDTSAWATVLFSTAGCSPTTISITGLTDNSADISCTGVSGATGYEYAVDMSATPPSSGTATGATTYSATSLASATSYYAHVRAVCTGGVFSPWDNEPFTTFPLDIQSSGNSSFRLDAAPNPATNRLYITVQGAGNNGTARITDLTGKTLIVQNITTGKAEMDISHLSPGIYLLRYEDDQHIQSLKLNKQ